MPADMYSLWADESGQDLAEYAILLALVALIVIAAVRLLGPTIRNVFNDLNDNLAAA